VAYDFTIIRGNTLPVMRVTCATQDGPDADLVVFPVTGATVTLIGKGPDGIAYSLPMDIEDGPNGIVAMNWTAVQTTALVLGLHHFWVKVVTTGGEVQTFPNASNSITLTGHKMLVGDAP
jgi:hypothetical protein